METTDLEKLKKGNKVKIISIGKHKRETFNWIQCAGNIKTGEEFIVEDLKKGWIKLEGLSYWHPHEKFKLVK